MPVQLERLPSAALHLLGVIESLHAQGVESPTRVDIAAALGKRYISAAEMTHLEYLELAGRLESFKSYGDPALRYRVIS